jgi:GTPase SAR1 family protein
MSLLCGGGGDAEDLDETQKQIAAEAAKAIKDDAAKEAKVIKMLLLGAGESGKSTIFKQMKIINKDGYSEAERKSFIGIVHSNTVSSMNVLMDAFEKLEVDMPGDLEALNEQFKGLTEQEKLDPDIAAILKKMWEHSATKEIFERKSEFQLNDSADYYFNDIDRISEGSYIPTEQDVLRSRVRTTGIVQSDFVIKKMNFSMFDVGGQRNERRKWIHAFDNVNAVVFVAAISEYDQVLFEDETQNRMEEALSLFDQIVNSKWFKATAMILFLNKRDLFEMKMVKKPLSKYFPEYTGGDDNVKAAHKFWEEKFKAKNKMTEKSIYTHVTCATDTGNVKFVFNAVVAIILEDNLKASGLV